MLLDIFDIVVEPFFKIRESGRIVRSLLFVIGFLVWTFAAYAAHPPDFSQIKPWFTFAPSGEISPQLELMLATLVLFQELIQRILALIAPFFAPDIFRHVLVIWLASWIAFEWAVIYLDDIFELKNTEISRTFIWKAAFVGKLEKVHIMDGDVAAHNKDSPVVKIGGPGQVVVHLENAALFEKINGEAHIITSEDTSKQILLEGFERLRTVRYSNKPGDGYAIFDRRDQFVGSQTVTGRTKDGIVVTAKNVSVVFRIHEGKVQVAEPPVLSGGNGKIVTPQISRRVSFDRKALETAIKNLVYNQTNRPWTDTAKQNIFPSMRRWIGRHTLDEFLTNLSPQELAEVRERVQTLGVQNPLSNAGSVFLSRAELTNAVQGEDIEKWLDRGFDVLWVGVGTWETPEEIPQQHKKAFELSVQNRILGSEMELSRLRRESRVNSLTWLVQEVPIKSFAEALRIIYRRSTTMSIFQLQEADRPQEAQSKLLMDPKDAAEVKYKLIIAYREKLKNARDLYERNQQAPPEELLATITHLTGFQPPSKSASIPPK